MELPASPEKTRNRVPDNRSFGCKSLSIAAEGSRRTRNSHLSLPAMYPHLIMVCTIETVQPCSEHHVHKSHRGSVCDTGDSRLLVYHQNWAGVELHHTVRCHDI